jgi:hypothetical protein
VYKSELEAASFTGMLPTLIIIGTPKMKTYQKWKLKLIASRFPVIHDEEIGRDDGWWPWKERRWSLWRSHGIHC